MHQVSRSLPQFKFVCRSSCPVSSNILAVQMGAVLVEKKMSWLAFCFHNMQIDINLLLSQLIFSVEVHAAKFMMCYLLQMGTSRQNWCVTYSDDFSKFGDLSRHIPASSSTLIASVTSLNLKLCVRPEVTSCGLLSKCLGLKNGDLTAFFLLFSQIYGLYEAIYKVNTCQETSLTLIKLIL